MFGIDNRTTRDMDITIKGIDVSKEKMVEILNEILSIDLQDGIKFKVVKITDINIENLRLSIKNTFNRRESFDYLKDYEQILEVIASNDRVLKMWNVYTRKNKYANGLKFEIIITELKLFISKLELDAIKF